MSQPPYHLILLAEHVEAPDIHGCFTQLRAQEDKGVEMGVTGEAMRVTGVAGAARVFYCVCMRVTLVLCLFIAYSWVFFALPFAQ